MRTALFSYDDICLEPKYSDLHSRSEADTSVNLFGKTWKLPVVPANMRDVISWEVANNVLGSNDFYIMHRFNGANKEFIRNQFSFDGIDFLSISLGVNEDSKKEYESFLEDDILPNVICIDVAHGHHKKVNDMVKWLGKYKKPFIIAGNVATADGYKYLCDLGVDAVKVGIGGGSICSTRYKTGFHIPTAYSIWDCVKNAPDYDVPIIADGGAKHYGDVAKALVLGADMVMSGRWFAECIDSPAEIKHGQKVYRGSTSFEAKGHNTHVEGHTLTIEGGCSYADRLLEIKQALQSSISYAGGYNLQAFRNVDWYIYK